MHHDKTKKLKIHADTFWMYQAALWRISESGCGLKATLYMY